MKVYFGNDHAIHLEDKLILINKIIDLGYEVINVGTNSDESVDYPDFAQAACNQAGPEDKVILICGTGIGISIAANKCKGIRCALCHIPEYAQLARQHNNANAIAMGARYLSVEQMFDIVKVFLSTNFEGGRHQKRIDKMEEVK